jgi:hypothetical protein
MAGVMHSGTAIISPQPPPLSTIATSPISSSTSSTSTLHSRHTHSNSQISSNTQSAGGNAATAPLIVTSVGNAYGTSSNAAVGNSASGLLSSSSFYFNSNMLNNSSTSSINLSSTHSPHIPNNMSSSLHHHTPQQQQQQQQPRSQPSLRIKTNELFYKWFSEHQRYEQLREIISYMKATGKVPKLSELNSFKTVC